MLTDTHCHPFDLLRLHPGAEAERRAWGVACAASAWSREQFERHEALAKAAIVEGAPPVFLCFGVHPQLPAEEPGKVAPSLETMASLAREGRLDGIGETGFDLFDSRFKETLPKQEALFEAHLETAERYGLPIVLHVRRAIPLVFARAEALSRVPAVVFHSWGGTLEEALALTRRRLNAFFSFGSGLLRNHRKAQRCAALLPPSRLLLETDAPYQPLRDRPWSSWGDLGAICRAAADLRASAGSPARTAPEVEAVTAANFSRLWLGAGGRKPPRKG